MAAAVSSEETVMVVLGKDSAEDKVTSDCTQHQSFEYLEETLPWDQSKESMMRKKSKTEARTSPEGRREEGTVGPAVDNEVFTKAPSTVATKHDDKENSGMPEAAPHVFVPIDSCCIEHAPKRNETQKRQHGYEEEIVHCETEKGDVEKQNFISRGYSAHFDDLPGYAGRPAKETSTERLPGLQKVNCSSVSLKAIASMVGALVISPCLIYGAFVFLPFDVPPMPTMSSRLVYTLRCGVFATFPIIVGMLVYGVSRLCFSSLQPFGELRREVEIHRRYISQSVQLFILYFFNIAVLSTYLPQEALKLIALLTALFAISRLLYWLAFAMGRAFRGFGFGLTFLPLVAMLLFNLYSMFLVDSESIFATTDIGDGSPTEKEQGLAAVKPRFWG